MTESEWLTGAPTRNLLARMLAVAEALVGTSTRDLSARMLAFVRDRGSDRQFRLLACAELRRYSWLDAVTAQALDLAERLADGEATTEEVSEFERRTTRSYRYTAPNPLVTPAVGFFANVLANVPHSGDSIQRFPPLLRDIFGNPFRPVTFSSEWRTDTAVLLASQMYDAREFSAMPILADALQDAGCDNEDILNHCRGDGSHVRGCWVVDLVSGKS